MEQGPRRGPARAVTYVHIDEYSDGKHLRAMPYCTWFLNYPPMPSCVTTSVSALTRYMSPHCLALSLTFFQ